jgi:hypothetical protein
MAPGKAVLRAAASISVLDGTHPVNVHSPPISPSATSSTRAPVAAPARAAPSPAAPPPITIRSQLPGTGQSAALAWSCGSAASSTCTPFQNATWFLIFRASGLGCG